MKKESSEHIKITLPPRLFPVFLVIAESYDANWNVTVDGKNKEIIPINPNFMGVEVLGKESEIIFKYEENIIENIANIVTVFFFVFLAVSLLGFRIIFRVK